MPNVETVMPEARSRSPIAPIVLSEITDVSKRGGNRSSRRARKRSAPPTLSPAMICTSRIGYQPDNGLHQSNQRLYSIIIYLKYRY
jgi:hypothetical protein